MGVEVVLGAALLGGAGASIYSGQKQASATKKAAQQQQRMAEQMAKEQERQYNRLNQKKPDLNAIQSQYAMSGVPPTQLTDMGVDPLLMLLSRDRAIGG